MDLLSKLISDHRWFYEQIALVDSQVFDYANKYYEKDWAQKVAEPCLEILRKILTRTLQHEELEDHVLFPALAEYKALDQDVLNAMEEDHGKIHRALHQFIDAVGPLEKIPDRERLLRLLRLVSLLQRHMIREEIEVFDVARQRLPADVLERLGENAVALES